MNKKCTFWVAAAAHTPLYLGILAVGLVSVTRFYFHLQIPVSFYFLVFMATWVIYTLDRVFSLSTDGTNQPGRTLFIKTNKNIIWISLALSVPSLLLFVLLYNFFFLICLSVLFFLSAFYLFLFSGIVSIRFSKYVALLKPVLIAAVWTGVVVLLPFAVDKSAGGSAKPALELFSGFRFLLYFSNAVLFDISDITGDRQTGKLNFALLFSQTQITILLAFVFCIELAILYFWGSANGFSVIGGEIFSAVFLMPFIFLLKENRSFLKKRSYAYAVDAILFSPIVWSLVLQI